MVGAGNCRCIRGLRAALDGAAGAASAALVSVRPSSCTIVNPIVLALLFYLVTWPIGMLMRMFSKSNVASGRDHRVETYWIRREIPGPPRKQ